MKKKTFLIASLTAITIATSIFIAIKKSKTKRGFMRKRITGLFLLLMLFCATGVIAQNYLNASAS